MKTILELIRSVVVVAAIYFGYQLFTGKMTLEEIKFYLQNLSVESITSKPYDCDTDVAEISALCLMFKGNSCDDIGLFQSEFLPKLNDVATIKRALIKLDSSSKSSVCSIDFDYDLSANSLDEARKKFESYSYINEGITNYGMKILFNMDSILNFNSKDSKSFDEKFKTLDEYKTFLEQREASQNMMVMFGGANLNRFYYKLFDNGKGEIWTQASGNLEDLR
ncbi:MAG: hypothetical protein GX282_01690 [Campylobacteraceae bacterium]|nr:hypothetical protein [Campylobacteraceae bacterium]